MFSYGRFLDPMNISGMADQTGPYPVGGSRVSGFGPGDPNDVPGLDDYWAEQAALGQAPHLGNQNGPQGPKGFLEGMMWNGTMPKNGLQKMLPAPPQHWVYDPKKGASWATPHRKGNTNEFNVSHDAPGSEGYNSFQGNRI